MSIRRSPSGDGPTIYRPNESVASVRLDPPARPVAYEPDSIPPPPRDSLLMRVNRRRRYRIGFVRDGPRLRFEPHAHRLVGSVDPGTVAGGGPADVHLVLYLISSTGVTPKTFNPDPITIPTACTNARRARVSSGSSSTMKRRAGSSRPRFQCAWKAAARS